MGEYVFLKKKQVKLKNLITIYPIWLKKISLTVLRFFFKAFSLPYSKCYRFPNGTVRFGSRLKNDAEKRLKSADGTVNGLL